ncbi:hypothetical protein FH972_023299 [Carpinus fangiana]|uniref:F-box domain-containing protein n=1 Tax=Carpinus fangiana TaxID=176857 RepID=A0A5N6KV45_9ROSI|nr:hypothetical protein FH972_023299 [Carpinus fangiana]
MGWEPAIFNLLALPLELRLHIYSFTVEDRSSRVGIAASNRQFHEEVMDVLYKDRDLVFDPRPDAFTDAPNHEIDIVRIMLQHKGNAVIHLPSLSWNRVHVRSGDGRHHWPQHLPFERLRLGRIVIHIYEPPSEDPGQNVLSWFCVDRIKNCFLERIDDEYVDLKNRIDIVTHPLSFTSQVFATHHKWLGVKWKDDLYGKHLPLKRLDKSSGVKGGTVVRCSVTAWPGLGHRCARPSSWFDVDMSEFASAGIANRFKKASGKTGDYCRRHPEIVEIISGCSVGQETHHNNN